MTNDELDRQIAILMRQKERLHNIASQGHSNVARTPRSQRQLIMSSGAISAMQAGQEKPHLFSSARANTYASNPKKDTQKKYNNAGDGSSMKRKKTEARGTRNELEGGECCEIIEQEASRGGMSRVMDMLSNMATYARP